MYTVAGLFSGIGGFEIAAKAAGFRIAMMCEISKFCRHVLEYWNPGVTIIKDIHDVEGCNERVDVVCGGFPCQDISFAGKGFGIAGDRSGLWCEMSRIISLLGPKIVLVENTASIVGRNLDRVLGDLHKVGYNAEWEVIPATAAGAPHLRERLYLVAYAHKEYGNSGLGNVLERSKEIYAESREQRARVWDETALGAYRLANGVRGRLYQEAVGALGNAVVPQIVQPLFEGIKQELETL